MKGREGRHQAPVDQVRVVVTRPVVEPIALDAWADAYVEAVLKHAETKSEAA